MTAHSGRWGVVNSQSTVRNWTLNEIEETKRFYASNTLSGAGRKPSVFDFTGSFSQYGAVPTVLPGETFTFAGFTAPDDDSETPGNGQRYTGPAIVDSVAITWNWENGEIISSVTNFAGNGRLVKAVDTALTDVSSVDAPVVCGTKIEYDTGSGDVEWGNIANAVLTMMCENQPYLNSSSIDNGECWRQRKKGNFDWTLALTEQASSRANLPNPGDDMILKLYTTDSLFWELKWGHLENFSNITVDRETGAIISRQVNLAMNGWNPTVGYVKKPDTTDFWPF